MRKARTTPCAKEFRSVILVLCCAAVVGGVGCATWYVNTIEEERVRSFHQQPAFQDVVVALGVPNEETLAKMGVPHAVAFLGEKHTYLLTVGGEQLLEIAQQVDGSKLNIRTGRKLLYVQDDRVWGELVLSYELNPGVPAESDAARRLVALGFQEESSSEFRAVYRAQVEVEGFLAAPLDLGPNVTRHLAARRTFAFFHPADAQPPMDPTRIVTLPVAVVVDVALSPVYVLGFLVVGIGAATGSM